MRDNHNTFLGHVKDKILRQELLSKYADTSFLEEVLAVMPCKIENTLNNYKHSLALKNNYFLKFDENHHNS